MDTKKNPRVTYEIIYGNIFWSIVLCETIIIPIYFFGFSLFNPIYIGDSKLPDEMKGVIK
jgi:cation transport ATPase